VRPIRNLTWQVPVVVVALGVLTELIDLPIGNVKNHQATSYKIGSALAGLGAVIFVIGVILFVIWAVGSLARRRRTAPAV
jgi:hypothetical protein